MVPTKNTLFALFAMAASPLALALPVNETDILSPWAQFCNDASCSEGCGISVDVANPGCLNQNGRRSIKFHGGNNGGYSLVVSPGPNCPCQSECTAIPSGDYCWDISGYSGAQSFRFQSEGCGNNNC